MKRFWRVISIITALAAGTFLYEGGKLLLMFRDLRVGGIVIAAGLLEVLAFVWSTYKSYGRTYGAEEISRIKRIKRRESIFTWIVCAVALVGTQMYRLRFGSVRRMALAAGIIMALILVVLVILFAVEQGFPLAEKEFRSQILQKKDIWEDRGLWVYDKTASQMEMSALDAKYGFIEVCGIALAACLELMQQIRLSRNMIFPIVMVIILLSVKVKMAVTLQNKVVRGVNEGDDPSTLGFFVKHYENARWRNDGISSIVRLDAVAALYDMGAYEDAMELLMAERRIPLTEVYFLQHEWLVREALRDREGCAEVIGQMGSLMHTVNGENRQKVEAAYRLFSDFTDRRYEKVIKYVEKNPGDCPRVQRLREKLANDAKNEIFGREE